MLNDRKDRTPTRKVARSVRFSVAAGVCTPRHGILIGGAVELLIPKVFEVVLA